jgi:hypothetical protein
MENKSEKKVGLFRVSYKIGGDKPGAPEFIVHFFVNTPHKTISGAGEITQVTNPPTDIPTQFDEGHYTYMCVMPKNCHILVNTKGHNPNEMPTYINVYLTMVVTEDWQSGTANYKYRDNKGNWQEVTNAPVQIIPGETIY